MHRGVRNLNTRFKNTIMTFFTKYSSTPCDKKCCSEHPTLFPLFGEGLGTRLWQLLLMTEHDGQKFFCQTRLSPPLYKAGYGPVTHHTMMLDKFHTRCRWFRYEWGVSGWVLLFLLVCKGCEVFSHQSTELLQERPELVGNACVIV